MQTCANGGEYHPYRILMVTLAKHVSDNEMVLRHTIYYGSETWFPNAYEKAKWSERFRFIVLQRLSLSFISRIEFLACFADALPRDRLCSILPRKLRKVALVQLRFRPRFSPNIRYLRNDDYE